MFRSKQFSTSIVVVLAISLILTPVLYAQQPAVDGSASLPVAQTAAPEPAPQPMPLPEGWWKLPAPGLNSETPFYVDHPAPPRREWTKTGKTLTIIGIPIAAAGAIMLAAGSSEDRIGDTDVAINWKATGAIWLGAGAVLTIIGLTRRR